MNDIENLSAGDLSVTDGQWVEMAWAARNASLPSLNGARRLWFEGVKALLRDVEPAGQNSNFNRGNRAQ